MATAALAIVERAKVHHEQVADCPIISVHCLTLLDLAVDALRRFSATAAGAEDTGGPAADLAYEVAALLAGALALDVVDTPEAIDRHVMLEHAYKLMDEAAMSFGLESGPCVALAVGVQAGAAAKAPQGYTTQQLHDVLEVIAGRTRTMQQLMMIAQGPGDSYETAVCLDAAVIIATEVGSIADMAVGADIIGDRDFWTFGPNFAAHGKAVQS